MEDSFCDVTDADVARARKDLRAGRGHQEAREAAAGRTRLLVSRQSFEVDDVDLSSHLCVLAVVNGCLFSSCSQGCAS
jgi:hypothetical protein